MIHFSLIPLCAFFFVSQLPAQEQAKLAMEWERAVTPKHAGTFSPKFGWQDSGERSARIGERLIVNNGQLSNYYSIPGANQEWVDNNTLYDLSTDHTEQVNGLQFLYCSSSTNPNGVAMDLYIYDHSVYCAGPVNWPVADCSYALAGLPGGNNGALACWAITVDLYGVECNLTSDPLEQRQMGWGQVWESSDSGPWIAGGGYGNTCTFTWWDRGASNANAFQGCYWFGCIPHTGFYLQLYGGPVDTNRYWAEDLGGTSTTLDNGLLDVDLEVKTGNTVTFQLSDPEGVGFDGMKLVYSTQPAASPILFGGANVLIDPNFMADRPVGPTSQSFTIPPLTGDYYTQAVCFRGGTAVGLSNALRHQAL